MYLSLGPGDALARDKFSWLIAKNPHSAPYESSLSSREDGRRKVHGQFTPDGDYAVWVENDPAADARAVNKDHRPTHPLVRAFAVLPYNLRGVAEALRSAVNGQNASGGTLTDAEVAAPHAWRATVGPFLAPWSKVGSTLHAFGLTATARVQQGVRVASLVDVVTEAPLSLAGFLQRILVASYYLSLNDHDEPCLPDSLVEKLIAMSRGWLGRSAHCERVIERLTRGVANMRAKFTDELAEAQNESEEQGEAEGALSPAAPLEQSLERKVSLHDRRHELLLGAIPADARTIVDLGCGDGRLTAKVVHQFKSARVLAIDASARSLARLTRRAPRVRAQHDHVVWTSLEVSDLVPDVMILCEVIEHLIGHDRSSLMKRIAELWCPTLLLLTTPNVAYNPLFGMAPGAMRHPDHKVEFDEQGFTREVLRPLSARYTFERLPLLEGDGLQPSFVLIARRKGPACPDLRLIWRGRALHAPFALEDVGYTCSHEEMTEGLTHPAFLSERQRIFYMAPTMAPVEYDARFPEDLEHPESAFDYYRQRGVERLVEQPKQMGSRAHLLCFRTERQAAQMGFSHPLTVLSRGGMPFFASRETLDALHAELAPRLDRDMIAFDAEILPWSLKAGGDDGARGLIEREFRLPVEAALLWKTALGRAAPQDADYLRVLSRFEAPGALRVVPFAMLAEADMMHRQHQWFFKNSVFWPARPAVKHARRLATLVGGLATFARCPSIEVDLTDPASRAESVQRWRDYLAVGGEGFVYKPTAPATLRDGAPVLEALKVRGGEYLRLIFGPDYREPDRFAQLTRRAIEKKRRVALQEVALSHRILHSFLHRAHEQREHALVAFLGMDGLAAPTLDPTL